MIKNTQVVVWSGVSVITVLLLWFWIGFTKEQKKEHSIGNVGVGVNG